MSANEAPAIPGIFRMTNHVCRECLGPIGQRVDGAVHLFKCLSCGFEHAGAINEICGCGMRKKDGKGELGFRCVRNPKQNPGFPAVIVLKRVPPSQRAEAQQALPIRFYKPVRVPGEF